VLPVPPLATGKAVPDRVIARVPLLVIGEPLILKNAGTEAATEVTVPEPAPESDHVIALLPPPCDVRTWPAVPAAIGRLKFQVPAIAWGKIETVPEVDPLNKWEDEDKLVKIPELEVPDPIEPGEEKVAPFNELAFKLATFVVLETVNGEVPVETVLINCVPEIVEDIDILVPVADPKIGVISVGVLAKTTLPDPVEVILPVPPLATGKAVPE
jgi:hypothetical protein